MEMREEMRTVGYVVTARVGVCQGGVIIPQNLWAKDKFARLLYISHHS